MTIDVVRARSETPHAKGLIHFNNAGSSIMPSPVADVLIGHLKRETEIGGYEAASEAQPRLEAMYGSLARLINAKPDEIAFIENATRAWDMAFYSLPFKAGDRILTAKSEYVSNVIAYMQVAKSKGVKLDIVPDDEHGQISLQALEEMIDERVKLIAISHVPTQGGLVNPAAAVGAIARRHGIPYLLDACQSVGQMPVDVEAIGCDMLSATGRKFLRGPRGTGFLYVRKPWIEKLDPPFLDLHAATWTSKMSYEVRPDARRFENWESYVAGRLGLGAAVDYAMATGLDAIQQRVNMLGASLRNQLQKIPRVQTHDLGRDKCAIVTMTHERVPADEVKQYLREHRINVSVSEVSSARLDFEDRKLNAVTRLSPHYFNTEVEIEAVVERIAAIQ
jgi:cysteine desulfurase / selenocysteine lyase